ncbi:TadE/TadG family type IV pilus assembly protein [Magnetospirillum sp. UT-4]|uniref:TadE/TadG family type IV pilus assembly protein n=1 Tax=Magnetospirillum sp. UT-4 TaxID=2681467 RepID=UPI00137D29F1|nr:TadE/TadG family type IV pilus assembly protein [Magnetospirillum sp. UT-4]CAA7615357.1 conserved hypothetical protein [Magnetospirillum sp. UT-4]
MPRPRLLAAEDGATAIEMAVALPVLMLLLMVMVESFALVWVNAAMESALREAARFGLTGWAPAGTDRRAAIMDILRRRTLGLVDDSSATIDMRVFGDFGQIGVPEPFDDTLVVNGRHDAGEEFRDINGNGRWDDGSGDEGAGGPGQVVLYTISYRSPFLTPLQRWIGGAGETLVRASAVVRNEPWDGAP